jgi:2-polyprenyl-6-methoxyphenol hydroxylase-like FAD-dependent oxidoreductase
MDVHVHGSGVVAWAQVLALAAQGVPVSLTWQRLSKATAAAHAHAANDVRCFALNGPSVALLNTLGVWQALPASARTAVHDMAVSGDDASSSLHFSAWQQHQRELAWIVDAQALEAALAQGVEQAVGRGSVQALALGSDALVEGASPPALHVIAEGRHSAWRDRMGVAMVAHRYDQHAVAARVVADRAHHHTARQWFLSPEVLALLPFDQPEHSRSYALVWSVAPERARDLQTMTEQAFESALAHAVGEAGLATVGRLTVASDRATWPLAVGRAERLHGHAPVGVGAAAETRPETRPQTQAAKPAAPPAWVLVGDAAHVVHPLAGQGLNLGLADVQALTRTLLAREAWRGLNDQRVLARYARERQGPVAAMGATTDALQQLFASDAPAARVLRNQGLALVDKLSPLKRWLAGQAGGR